MRITVSINEEQYPYVIEYIEVLRKNGMNVSKFLSDAANEYIKDEDIREKKRLKSLIKEVIEEEGFIAAEPTKIKSNNNDKATMRNKLNAMFAEIEDE